jgi:signal peptidase
MEPAFQRGDLLFLWNRDTRTEIGEVLVYNVRGKSIPIVHRVVRTFPEVEGRASAKKVKEITVYVLAGYPAISFVVASLC